MHFKKGNRLLSPWSLAFTLNVLISAFAFFGIIHPEYLSAVQTDLLTAKIDGSSPADIAYDPVNERMYVTDSAGGRVSILDTSTNTLIASPKVGTNPKGIAYDPINERMYVTNFGSGTVSTIDTKSKQAGISIPVGSGPQDIAYDPVNTRMYVTLLDNNSISVIDTKLNTIVGEPIKLGFSPQGIAYNDVNGSMYVTSFGSTGNVSVIDTKSNTVQGEPIKVGSKPQRIAYDSQNNRMYVTNSGSDTVSVIDSNVAMNIGSLYIDSPFGIAYDPKNQRMYVSSAINNVINVIETDTNTVVENPIAVGGSSRDLAYDSANNRLYIPNGELSALSVLQLLTLNTMLTSSKDGLDFEIANGTTSASDKITFSFHASDLNSKVKTYECRLDGSRFVDCSSPTSYDKLESGFRHAFEVRIVDENGNKGEPSRFVWQVDVPFLRDDLESNSRMDYGSDTKTGFNNLDVSECNNMNDPKIGSNEHVETGTCNYDQSEQKRLEEKVNQQDPSQLVSPSPNATMTNLVIPLPL